MCNMENQSWDLLDPSVRAKLLGTHPLFDGKTIVMTPAINNLNKLIRRAALLGEKGLCFSAASGIGKSVALVAAKAFLGREMKGVPVIIHSFQNNQAPSIRGFYKHFLNSAQHASTKGETAELRQRLSQRFIDNAYCSDRKMVVLLVDEAQAMKTQDLLFLKDLDNDLVAAGARLLPVFMAQEPDFSEIRKRIYAEGRLDLIGRFLMRPLKFEGFRTLDDFRIWFRDIDRNEYPLGSGWTWTRFFFPEAWENGFRMEYEADRFFGVLSKAVGMRTRDEICASPARQIFLAVRAFMLDNAGFDAPQMRLDEHAWSSALEYARVEAAAGLINEDSDINDDWQVTT
ncbi:MAG TPA: ATP-binding protein [Noviherbaspirillum sp.]|nr:ATP-binding protein [Noviherbaspirillum sp.]